MIMIIIIIIIIINNCRFWLQGQLMVFHWGLVHMKTL